MQRQTVTSILLDCARLLQLTSGEDDPAQTFSTIGYVEGRLVATADAVRANDTATLGHIATALDGEVSRRQAQQP
jgi:hypothetical protein